MHYPPVVSRGPHATPELDLRGELLVRPERRVAEDLEVEPVVLLPDPLVLLPGLDERHGGGRGGVHLAQRGRRPQRHRGQARRQGADHDLPS